MATEPIGPPSLESDTIELEPWSGQAPPPPPPPGAAHELVMVYRGVTEREVRAVGYGQLSFALVVEPPLIVLCYRFGDVIPWSIAPFHWVKMKDQDRFVATVPDGPSAEPRGRVRIRLVEAKTNRVCAVRTAILSSGLTRAWNSAIRRQSSRPCSRARYDAALAQFTRVYRRADALLSRAVALSIDGE